MSLIRVDRFPVVLWTLICEISMASTYPVLIRYPSIETRMFFVILFLPELNNVFGSSWSTSYCYCSKNTNGWFTRLFSSETIHSPQIFWPCMLFHSRPPLREVMFWLAERHRVELTVFRTLLFPSFGPLSGCVGALVLSDYVNHRSQLG